MNLVVLEALIRIPHAGRDKAEVLPLRIRVYSLSSALRFSVSNHVYEADRKICTSCLPTPRPQLGNRIARESHISYGPWLRVAGSIKVDCDWILTAMSMIHHFLPISSMH
jgi:hypothetical protein